MSGAQAYPLAWPIGWPRTPRHKREASRFTTSKRNTDPFDKKGKPVTVAEAIQRLSDELDRLGARLPVVSTNLELRLNGLPRSGQPEPTDPGVCVYFQLRGKATTMPCDRYTTVAGNIAAVAAHIDAVRRIERYGVGTLDQMFTGFQALRGPGPRPWREILGVPPDAVVTIKLVRARQRELARQHHPDVGGREVRMAEINSAADQAISEMTL